MLKYKIGYVVISNINDSIETIKTRIAALSEPQWIGVVIRNPEILSDLFTVLEDKKIPFNIVDLKEDINEYDHLDLFLKNYKSGWTFVTKTDFEINQDKIKKITKIEKPFALISNSDSNVNEWLFPNSIFLYLKGSKAVTDNDTGEVSFLNYFEKINKFSKSMLFNWEDI